MTENRPTKVEVHGENFTHTRLIELGKLADAALPFYAWVEVQAKLLSKNENSLTTNLMAMSLIQIQRLISSCYSMGDIRSVPALFDGVGKQYPHKKACYYFFAWALRDAPVQRLQQLIARAKTTASPQDPLETEAEVLAHLFVAYRNVLGNFDWAAVREVIIDRLEGSRRAIRGHQKEAVVRTALTVALQTYFKKYGSYGRFDKIKVLNREVHIDTETFDVCVELIMPIEHSTERILIPVKTRETEGGGHSHLFTRDITSAITTAKASDTVNWVAVFIIAENWSQREQDRVTDIADFAVALKMSPGDFETVDDDTQQQFGEFVAKVLDGSQKRK